jgi:hypothetical protein
LVFRPLLPVPHPERDRPDQGRARADQRGLPSEREDLAALSPYQTRHIKRFGGYLLPDGTPEPFDGELVMPLTTTPDEGAAQQATA